MRLRFHNDRSPPIADAPTKPSMTKTTESQIIAANVGVPRQHNGPIRLVRYDPAWPRHFTSEAAVIHEALGESVVALEHVGSTSVPGLVAKPVIDLVLCVADSSNEGDYLPRLEARGYRLRIREPDWFEHRLLNSPRIDANLHVFSTGCAEVHRMISFRDWLRAHPDDRALYQRAKQRLAKRTWQYTQHYADAKSNVIQEILGRIDASRDSLT